MLCMAYGLIMWYQTSWLNKIERGGGGGPICIVVVDQCDIIWDHQQFSKCLEIFVFPCFLTLIPLALPHLCNAKNALSGSCNTIVMWSCQLLQHLDLSREILAGVWEGGTHFSVLRHERAIIISYPATKGAGVTSKWIVSAWAGRSI